MCEAQLQHHFKIQPSEFRNMTEDEFVREYAKLKYIVDSQNKAYKKKTNKPQN